MHSNLCIFTNFCMKLKPTEDKCILHIQQQLHADMLHAVEMCFNHVQLTDTLPTKTMMYAQFVCLF